MTDAELNDFAIRSFRNTADGDYIVARMAYRAELTSQFLWSALQAVEKYLKCVLLLNRIPAKRLGHDLGAALKVFNREGKFSLRLSESSRGLIEHLDTYGRFRYLETPYHIKGPEIFYLDRLVWEIRRYCTVLDYTLELADGRRKSMLELELRKIEQGEERTRQRYPWFTGELERIISKPAHPARKSLIWQNAFFGQRGRQHVSLPLRMHAVNSPLSLRPQLIDEVLKYVHLPAPVVAAYRAQIAQGTP